VNASLLHTGASLLLKVAYDVGQAKTIGFAHNLSYSVSQGQKVTYVVDSCIPAEIAQGAGPSFVKGSLNVFFPKGTTPESVGLVPYRIGPDGSQYAQLSKYLSFQIFDRKTLSLIMALEQCKVGSYSFVAQARGVVQLSLQFDGILATPGVTL
jgi:hypothetical protein